MKSPRLLAAIAAISLFSCQHLSTPEDPLEKAIDTRAPAAANPLMAFSDWKDLAASADFFTPKSCQKSLGPIHRTLASQQTLLVDLRSEPRTSVGQERVSRALKDLFETRRSLLEKFKRFEKPSPECVSLFREVNRLGRDAEEILSLWLYEHGFAKADARLLRGGFPQMSGLTAFSPEDLKGGDVLLLRGRTFVSAMIARVGDLDSHFSHLAMVGEDGKGRKFLIESLIEVGVVITPLKEWIAKNVEARMAIYRPVDPKIANFAGRSAYAEMSERLRVEKEVFYDFAMDTSEKHFYFCSEIVDRAFAQATGDAWVIPRHRTSLKLMSRNSFLKQLGITVADTFAPTDIEYDPRFRLLAEYRHLEGLNQIIRDDTVASAAFRWMEKRNYELRTDTPIEALIGDLAKQLRQLGFLKDKMQSHMPASTVAHIIRYKFLSDGLNRQLAQAERFFKEDRPMSEDERMAALEKYRFEDCDAYLQTQGTTPGRDQPKPWMHKIFRPDNARTCYRK